MWVLPVKLNSHFLLIVILFSVTPTWSQQFIGIYGPEFTFCRADGNIERSDEIRFEEAAHLHLVTGQPEGAKFECFVNPNLQRNGFRSPNGWSFTQVRDRGVLEVQMNPMTVKEFKAFANDIQDAIFVTAANQGYFPFAFQGGGHINLDINSFNANALLLRNFIVDYWNHNELALGIFNYDTNNALSLSLQSEEHVAKVRRIIDRFDRGEFLLKIGEITFPFNFLSELNELLLYNRDKYVDHWNNNHLMIRSKSTDISFFHATATRLRLEIRAVRPQKDIKTWINQIELIDARINYLAQFKAPIPLNPILQIKDPSKMTFEKTVLNPPVRPQLALRAFYRYVTESGLKWIDHRNYIWPDWIKKGELERFENSAWFKSQSRKCEAYL